MFMIFGIVESWLIQINSFRPFQSAPSLTFGKYSIWTKICLTPRSLFGNHPLIWQSRVRLVYTYMGLHGEIWWTALFVFFAFVHRNSHKVVISYGWFKRMLERAEVSDVEMMNSWWEWKSDLRIFWESFRDNFEDASVKILLVVTWSVLMQRSVVVYGLWKEFLAYFFGSLFHMINIT